MQRPLVAISHWHWRCRNRCFRLFIQHQTQRPQHLQSMHFRHLPVLWEQGMGALVPGCRGCTSQLTTLESLTTPKFEKLPNEELWSLGCDPLPPPLSQTLGLTRSPLLKMVDPWPYASEMVGGTVSHLNGFENLLSFLAGATWHLLMVQPRPCPGRVLTSRAAAALLGGAGVSSRRAWDTVLPVGRNLKSHMHGLPPSDRDQLLTYRTMIYISWGQSSHDKQQPPAPSVCGSQSSLIRPRSFTAGSSNSPLHGAACRGLTRSWS